MLANANPVLRYEVAKKWDREQLCSGGQWGGSNESASFKSCKTIEDDTIHFTLADGASSQWIVRVPDARR
jgi:hypothetical protein